MLLDMNFSPRLLVPYGPGNFKLKAEGDAATGRLSVSRVPCARHWTVTSHFPRSRAFRGVDAGVLVVGKVPKRTQGWVQMRKRRC